eukprot:COSAG02_NODE_15584_length_1158_cov_1.239849_2_plen_155_part_01
MDACVLNGLDYADTAVQRPEHAWTLERSLIGWTPAAPVSGSRNPSHAVWTPSPAGVQFLETGIAYCDIQACPLLDDQIYFSCSYESPLCTLHPRGSLGPRALSSAARQRHIAASVARASATGARARAGPRARRGGTSRAGTRRRSEPEGVMPMDR